MTWPTLSEHSTDKRHRDTGSELQLSPEPGSLQLVTGTQTQAAGLGWCPDSAVITSMSTDVAGWQADREADRQAGRQILYTSPLGIVCFEHSFSEWQTQIDLGGPAADPLNLIRMFSHTQI